MWPWSRVNQREVKQHLLLFVKFTILHYRVLYITCDVPGRSWGNHLSRFCHSIIPIHFELIQLCFLLVLCLFIFDNMLTVNTVCHYPMIKSRGVFLTGSKSKGNCCDKFVCVLLLSLRWYQTYILQFWFHIQPKTVSTTVYYCTALLNDKIRSATARIYVRCHNKLCRIYLEKQHKQAS